MSWWRGLVPVRVSHLTGKPGAGQGSPLRVAPPVQSDTTVIITSVWGGAQEPQSGFLDGMGGGAGRAASCSPSTRLWTCGCLGTFVVVVQLLDKAADGPVAVPPRFRVLLGVKGVGDVLAGL